jgi:hypothetical protein
MTGKKCDCFCMLINLGIHEDTYFGIAMLEFFDSYGICVTQ